MAGGERPGIDLEALTAWLSARVDLAGPLAAVPISGGRSNLTYLLDDGAQRFVLRRPPLGEILRGAHDVGREHRIVDQLQGAVPLAETLAFCADEDVIGAPFSVVSFVDGLALREPADADELSEAGRRALVGNVASTLAALHGVDPARSGLEPDRGQDFVARQLHVWRRQLQAEPVRPLPGMDEAADRLAASIPAQRRVSVVHGDYRLDNLLVDRDGEVRAIIDWELWTLGDPLADLGAAVAYWTDSTYELAPLGTSPTGLGTLGGRDELVAAYEAAGGAPVDPAHLAWYVAFGTWRFAAILEGVYRRNLADAYGDGGDDGWRRLGSVVPVLAEIAMQHLRRS